VPSHPSQVYEALWLLAGIPLALALGGPRRNPPRVHPYVAWADRVGSGRSLFVSALAWFLVGRFLVGFTWRDSAVVGPLNMEQLLALVLLAAGGTYLWLRRSRLARAAAVMLCLVLAGCGASNPVTPIGSVPPSATTGTPRPAPSPTPSSTSTSTPDQPQVSIDSLLANMSADQKIGQLFMVSFYGDSATVTTAAQATANRKVIGTDNITQAIAQYHLGGVIYFDWAGNLVSAAQIATLSNSIQAAGAAQSVSVPLLIMHRPGGRFDRPLADACDAVPGQHGTRGDREHRPRAVDRQSVGSGGARGRHQPGARARGRRQRQPGQPDHRPALVRVRSGGRVADDRRDGPGLPG